MQNKTAAMLPTILILINLLSNAVNVDDKTYKLNAGISDF